MTSRLSAGERLLPVERPLQVHSGHVYRSGEAILPTNRTFFLIGWETNLRVQERKLDLPRKRNLDNVTGGDFSTRHGRRVFQLWYDVSYGLKVGGSKGWTLIFRMVLYTGARSRSRDLESQLIIVTRNDDLRRRLHEEQQRMFKRGLLFSRNVFQEAERKTVFWINGFVWLLKSFF